MVKLANCARRIKQTNSIHSSVDNKQASNHVWPRQGRKGTWKGRCQAPPQGPQGQHPGCVTVSNTRNFHALPIRREARADLAANTT